MSKIPRPCSPRPKSPRRSSAAEPSPSEGPRLVYAASPAATSGPVIVYQVDGPAPSASSSHHEPVLVYQHRKERSSSSRSPSPPPAAPRGRAGSAARTPSAEARARHQEPQSCCIMDRIEKKYDESSSELDGQHLYIVLCFQAAVATLLFLLFLCVPVAMITVGALNLSNCRLSYGIPLCLTIAGCAYLLIPLLSAALDWNAGNGYCPAIISLLVAVAVAASAAGSVYVFSGMWPSAEPQHPRYCHPAVYYFSFVMWTSFIVFIPVMLVASVVVFRKYGKHNVHAATMSVS
ncbi:uncharacterized protein LOC144173290 [Haemaphysalis longicornis]